MTSIEETKALAPWTEALNLFAFRMWGNSLHNSHPDTVIEHGSVKIHLIRVIRVRLSMFDEKENNSWKKYLTLYVNLAPDET